MIQPLRAVTAADDEIATERSCPVAATPEMIAAGDRQRLRGGSTAMIWRAMMDAAPDA